MCTVLSHTEVGTGYVEQVPKHTGMDQMYWTDADTLDKLMRIETELGIQSAQMSHYSVHGLPMSQLLLLHLLCQMSSEIILENSLYQFHILLCSLYFS